MQVRGFHLQILGLSFGWPKHTMRWLAQSLGSAFAGQGPVPPLSRFSLPPGRPCRFIESQPRVLRSREPARCAATVGRRPRSRRWCGNCPGAPTADARRFRRGWRGRGSPHLWTLLRGWRIHCRVCMRPAFGIGSGTPYEAAIPQARDRRHPCLCNSRLRDYLLHAGGAYIHVYVCARPLASAAEHPTGRRSRRRGIAATPAVKTKSRRWRR